MCCFSPLTSNKVYPAPDSFPTQESKKKTHLVTTTATNNIYRCQAPAAQNKPMPEEPSYTNNMENSFWTNDPEDSYWELKRISPTIEAWGSPTAPCNSRSSKAYETSDVYDRDPLLKKLEAEQKRLLSQKWGYDAVRVKAGGQSPIPGAVNEDTDSATFQKVQAFAKSEMDRIDKELAKIAELIKKRTYEITKDSF